MSEAGKRPSPRVGRTLDPGFEFRRGAPRQVRAVYTKNTRLALRSWPTYAIFYGFEILMVCVVGAVLLLLGEDEATVEEPKFNTPEGKYTQTPRSNQQLGPALTWVAPAIRTPGMGDNTGWGVCEKDSLSCWGMAGSINQPANFKSGSDSEQLSVRFPRDESAPITSWELFPSFEQAELAEYTTHEGAREAATAILRSQLTAFRELATPEEEVDTFSVVYPWAILADSLEKTGSEMYVRGQCSAFPQDMLDYRLGSSHHLLFPRKSQNIVSIVSDAFAMEALGVLQTAQHRYALTENFSMSDSPDHRRQYLMTNATWRALPYYQYGAENSNMAENVGMFMYPLVLLLVTVPNILYTLAAEKQAGLKRAETLMGLGEYKRLVGNFCFYAVIDAIAVVFLYAIAALFGLPFATRTGVLFTILLVVAAVAVIPLHAIFLSAFFSSGKGAALLGILLIVVEFIFFFALSGNGAYTNGWWNVYPIFGLLAMFRAVSEGVIPNSPETVLTLDNMRNGPDSTHAGCVTVILNACLSIVISVFIYAPLGVYVEQIMPNGAIQRHWLYPFESIVKRAHHIQCTRAGSGACSYDVECATYDANITIGRIYRSIVLIVKTWYHDKQHEKRQPLVSAQDSEVLLSGASDKPYDTETPSAPLNKTAAFLQSLGEVIAYRNAVEDDDDLRAMQLRAQNGDTTGDERGDIVRVIGLIRAYGKIPKRLPPMMSEQPNETPNGLKVSVKGISFTVRKDECFGLLGPNGAGKSTTLGILSGAHRQSAGRVLIDGCDTIYADKAAQRHIKDITGVCEQFDTLYPKLTVREHLCHAAEIKGIDPELMDEHVTDIINGVGLSAQTKMRSGAMSGGMQRRLSVGLAMICSPKIIYFDEPTTGLDPETRRSLWTTLMTLKRRRSLVLCTHSLDECEYLCSSPASNIAIMANGGLRGVGTAEHLKRRFGEGAKIQVMVNSNAPVPAANADAGDRVEAVAQSINAATNGIHLTPMEQVVHNMISTRVNISLASAYCGTLTYNIVGTSGEGKRPRIAGVFRIMEQIAVDCPAVVDWGVSLTSLESVFLNIVTASAVCQA